MAKPKLIILLLLTTSTSLNAQTFSEWFRQAKTQKKYLLEQIAALQVYANYVEKGYSIAQTGLNTIHQIKDGDFSLHAGYFNSLKLINPKVGEASRVKDMLRLAREIKNSSDKMLQEANNSSLLTVGEKKYIQAVLSKLLNQCGDNTTSLIQLVTPNQIQLKDDERLARIEELFEDCEEKVVFVKSFFRAVQPLITQRKNEENEIENISSYSGIKK
jgi:hypothetical protein